MFWPFGKKKPVGDEAPVELPVPTFVKPFLVPDRKKSSLENVYGSIRCACGCADFSAMHSVDDDRLYHLLCRDCGQDVTLFDGQRYGWDALVCQTPMEDLQSGEAAERCPKCSCADFRADVWYEPTAREEYDSCREALPEEDWVNAFTWFGADLICSSCGHRLRSWADVETA